MTNNILFLLLFLKHFLEFIRIEYLHIEIVKLRLQFVYTVTAKLSHAT